MIIGGTLIVVAVIVMIISATLSTAEFYLSIQELKESGEKYSGENVRIAGAVLGDSINYDSVGNKLHFTLMHIPVDEKEIERLGGIGLALHQAVNSPSNPQIEVVYNGPKPEMLKHEAQAVVTGMINSEGVFVAEELLLKCPSKYEEAEP
jgi:cytochrome c-type biogenesis protein CcmE